MSDLYCDCENWKSNVRNYDEVFAWISKYNRWYILWVKLSENEGFTQVNRYAIPISFCPCCGKKLKDPEGG